MPAAEDAATSSPLQPVCHLQRRDGMEPVGASSVQRPSSVRGAPPGETLGIFGGRVSPQLGKGGRPVHNQNFFLLVTPRHDVKKVSPGEKKTGVVNKA